MSNLDNMEFNLIIGNYVLYENTTENFNKEFISYTIPNNDIFPLKRKVTKSSGGGQSMTIPTVEGKPGFIEDNGLNNFLQYFIKNKIYVINLQLIDYDDISISLNSKNETKASETRNKNNKLSSYTYNLKYTITILKIKYELDIIFSCNLGKRNIKIETKSNSKNNNKNKIKNITKNFKDNYNNLDSFTIQENLNFKKYYEIIDDNMVSIFNLYEQKINSILKNYNKDKINKKLLRKNFLFNIDPTNGTNTDTFSIYFKNDEYNVKKGNNEQTNKNSVKIKYYTINYNPEKNLYMVEINKDFIINFLKKTPLRYSIDDWYIVNFLYYFNYIYIFIKEKIKSEFNNQINLKIQEDNFNDYKEHFVSYFKYYLNTPYEISLIPKLNYLCIDGNGKIIGTFLFKNNSLSFLFFYKNFTQNYDISNVEDYVKKFNDFGFYKYEKKDIYDLLTNKKDDLFDEYNNLFEVYEYSISRHYPEKIDLVLFILNRISKDLNKSLILSKKKSGSMNNVKLFEIYLKLRNKDIGTFNITVNDNKITKGELESNLNLKKLLNNRNQINLVPSNYIIPKNYIIKLINNLLIISFNEGNKKYDDNDTLVLLNYINKIKPVVIVIGTQESNNSTFSSASHFQHILKNNLGKINYTNIDKETTKAKGLKIYKSVRTRIYINNDKADFINKNENNNSNNKKEFSVKLLFKEISKKSNLGNILKSTTFKGSILQGIEIEKNKITKKIIFVNSHLYFKSGKDTGVKIRENNFKKLIEEFKLPDFHKNGYNIFFFGDLNFRIINHTENKNINKDILLSTVKNHLLNMKNINSNSKIYDELAVFLSNMHNKTNKNSSIGIFYRKILYSLLNTKSFLSSVYKKDHKHENLKNLYKLNNESISKLTINDLKNIYNINNKKSIEEMISNPDRILFVISKRELKINKESSKIFLFPTKSNHKMVSLMVDLKF